MTDFSSPAMSKYGRSSLAVLTRLLLLVSLLLAGGVPRQATSVAAPQSPDDCPIVDHVTEFSGTFSFRWNHHWKWQGQGQSLEQEDFTNSAVAVFRLERDPIDHTVYPSTNVRARAAVDYLSQHTGEYGGYEYISVKGSGPALSDDTSTRVSLVLYPWNCTFHLTAKVHLPTARRQDNYTQYDYTDYAVVIITMKDMPVPEGLHFRGTTQAAYFHANVNSPVEFSISGLSPRLPGEVEAGTFSWSFAPTRGDLWVKSVELDRQEVPGGGWVDLGPEGTVDGNLVRVRAVIQNDGNAPQTGSITFMEEHSARLLCGPAEHDVPANGSIEVTCHWNTEGFAWTDDGRAQSDRQVVVQVEAPGTGDINSAAAVVRPKPVVLVHGLWSNAGAWHQYDSFLSNVHSLWKAYAVGDGRAPGVMDTGTQAEPLRVPKKIQENAEILQTYLDAVRDQEDAWHVDIVGHSMGGLISRYYIHQLMRNAPDGKPAVRRLVMLGTPNQGSSCALVWAVPASAQLVPDYVQIFNSWVTNRRGVPFSILAGNPLYPTCLEDEDGDLVVSVSSARWNLTDTALTGSLHTGMNVSQSDFSSFVKPRLALGPAGAAAASQAFALQPTSALTVTLPAPQLIAAETVTVTAGGSLDVALPVPAASDLGVTLVGPAEIGAQLRRPNGSLEAEIVAGSEEAGQPARFFYVSAPVAGNWVLRLENTGTNPVTLPVSGWVEGSAVELSVQIETDLEGTRATLVTSLLQDGQPLAGAAVAARLDGMAGGTFALPLSDDGSGADVQAGDGLYTGSTGTIPADVYMLLVQADTGDNLRYTSGVINLEPPPPQEAPLEKIYLSLVLR